MHGRACCLPAETWALGSSSSQTRNADIGSGTFSENVGPGIFFLSAAPSWKGFLAWLPQDQSWLHWERHRQQTARQALQRLPPQIPLPFNYHKNRHIWPKQQLIQSLAVLRMEFRTCLSLQLPISLDDSMVSLGTVPLFIHLITLEYHLGSERVF